MQFITGKHIPRRTFIRGVGATVALPFLDAMVPAGRLWSKALRSVDTPRLVAIEIVHGAAGAGNTTGEQMHLWNPAGLGHDFDLTGTSLEPLSEWRNYLTIISNTDVRMAEAYTPREIGGDHFRSSAVFLTQAHPLQTEGSDVYASQSLDQLYARYVGDQVPIPSIQQCIEPVDQAGGCLYGYSCMYTDSISWAGPNQPLPMVRDPRVVFEQLFGEGATPEERQMRLQAHGSILDIVAQEVGRLKRALGATDRQRMEAYLANVREVEQRLQRIMERNASGEERELPEAPAGVPDSFEEHIKLHFDLQVLAFQTDMTRVFSLKAGRDVSIRVYPESGTDRAFHAASHHSEDQEALREFALINRYHVAQVVYLLERLKETQDGDGNLLDKTAVIYGSPMADGNKHNHRRAPLFLAGRANGALEGNLHLKTPDGTPMANVFLTLLQGMGMRHLKSFGDSTGGFSLSTGAYRVADV